MGILLSKVWYSFFGNKGNCNFNVIVCFILFSYITVDLHNREHIPYFETHHVNKQFLSLKNIIIKLLLNYLNGNIFGCSHF